jgi:hypothetical protein
VTTGTGSPGGWWRWLVLLLAAAAIVVRAPVYFSTPSFWAEEGAYHFAIAWERPPLAALTYQRAGYLNLWANLATTTAARLVRAGVISLTHAPFVTVTFAFAVQLLLVALIAWSRAPFWGGPGRRIVGIVAVLAGAMTDEIWLTTINSQHWLVLASVLLLLEPPDGSCARRWATIAILLVTGLSSPVAAVLLPLYAWRAWRTGTRAALEQAAVVALCALVQAWCLWSAVQIGEPLPDRAKGLDFGVFAAAAWMRTIVVPTLGADAARRFVGLLIRAGGPGAVSGIVLLALEAALLVWLARGLPPGTRVSLLGGYLLITTFSLLASVGNKAIMLNNATSSSRYVYAPGVLVLFMLLGCARLAAGRLRAVACVLLLACGLAHGLAGYRSSLRWRTWWPLWPERVQTWERNPGRALMIWPPPWYMRLAVPPRPES